jgi:hypothetical protein
MTSNLTHIITSTACVRMYVWGCVCFRSQNETILLLVRTWNAEVYKMQPVDVTFVAQRRVRLNSNKYCTWTNAINDNDHLQCEVVNNRIDVTAVILQNILVHIIIDSDSEV